MPRESDVFSGLDILSLCNYYFLIVPGDALSAMATSFRMPFVRNLIGSVIMLLLEFTVLLIKLLFRQFRTSFVLSSTTSGFQILEALKSAHEQNDACKHLLRVQASVRSCPLSSISSRERFSTSICKRYARVRVAAAMNGSATTPLNYS